MIPGRVERIDQCTVSAGFPQKPPPSFLTLLEICAGDCHRHQWLRRPGAFDHGVRDDRGERHIRRADARCHWGYRPQKQRTGVSLDHARARAERSVVNPRRWGSARPPHYRLTASDPSEGEGSANRQEGSPCPPAPGPAAWRVCRIRLFNLTCPVVTTSQRPEFAPNRSLYSGLLRYSNPGVTFSLPNFRLA